MRLKSYWFLSLFFCAGLAGVRLPAAVVHVSGTQTTNSPADGLTWATAFPGLATAAATAVGGDQLWLAAGTYTGLVTLKSEVALYGGFGGDETTLSARDWKLHRAILDGGGTNSVLVVEPGAAASTRLDGVTVTNGRAAFGAGIRCADAAVVVENVRVMRNTATRNGGGILCSNAQARIVNCLLYQNSAVEGGAGVHCFESRVDILTNQILGNACGGPSFFGGRGGGVYCGNRPTGGRPVEETLVTIRGNLIKNNRSGTGGGVECDEAATALLEGNQVALNVSYGGVGGGLECYACSPTVRGNRFVGNRLSGAGLGGSAIAVFGQKGDGTKPLIENNTIAGNINPSGGAPGAVYCNVDAGVVIRNNTFVGNLSFAAGAALNIQTSEAWIVNNLIVSNSTAVVASRSSLHHNGLFGCGNDGAWVAGNTNGNFIVEPRFTSNIVYGDVHLRPDSPCRNAGTDAFGVGDVDQDGELRVRDGAVDVGADEVGDTAFDWQPTVVRVAPDGDDFHDGASWDTPLLSVQAAIDHAAATGGEVWIQEGIYPVRLLQLQPYAHVFGGFAGNEIRRDQRDWSRHPTVLDGQHTGTVVVCTNVTPCASLDGFTIANGTSTWAGAVYLYESSVTLANNQVISNAGPIVGGLFVRGGAPVVSNNVIAFNLSRTVGGISAMPGRLTLLNNQIVSNTVEAPVAGVAGGVSLDVALASDSEATIVSGNWIARNRLTPAPDGRALALGLLCSGSFAGRVVNNTIIQHTNDNPTAATVLFPGGRDQLFANNLVAFNSAGVAGLSKPEVFLNNCIYGNGGQDYVGAADQTGERGNVRVDPRLAADGLHLETGSGCAEVGLSSVAAHRFSDSDGEARWQGAAVDIGADEFTATPEWRPLMDPLVPGSVVVTNVGGIMYAWFDAEVGEACRTVVTPVSLELCGPDFQFTYEVLRSSVPCPDPQTNRQVQVLGKLLPGVYHLQWSSWGTTTASLPFVVSDSEDRTLHSVISTPHGDPEFSVQGVPSVEYVVLQSTDLASWIPVQTNLGAPFTFSPMGGAAAAEFFQVQIREAP